MCPDRGLDTLVEGFAILKAKDGLKDVRLRIAGGATVSDKAFVNQIRKSLRRQGLLEYVEFLPDFDWPDRANFLKSLSVLCVPEKHPMAGGIYVLEAWATGVPVVEPDMGAFCELLRETGGGLLYEPGNTQALAESLEVLLCDPQRAVDMGQRGRDAVCKQYNIEQTAERMVQVFDKVATRYR
jgi:glycosyltransferase involved in cell wall biosynthesis